MATPGTNPPGMPAPLRVLLALLVTACGLVDPNAAPELVPTLSLRCEHPDLWFEGIYPGPGGLHSFPAAKPHRPAALATQLPTAAWDGPDGDAAQSACADVCVGAAQPGFFHHCPDAGWRITAEPGLAPPAPEFPPELAALVDPEACFPDSLCADAFAAPPGARLRAPAGTIAPGQTQADHLGVLADPAALDLELAGAAVTHPLHGRAEYSAGTCEADRCPFYLASLTLTDRGARSHAALDLGPATLQDLQLDLQRPALGIYTPATGAIELPVGALDLRIRLDLRAGAIDPGPRELRLRNPVPLHGRFDAGALHLELDLPLPGPGNARLDLEFTPLAHPPVPAFDPPARISAGPRGLLLPQDPGERSSLHAAHDPDGDLASLHWVVDGIPGARHLPPGEHEVALWVADRRGALGRSPVRTILVTPSLR
jgi:hypothetical protein